MTIRVAVVEVATASDDDDDDDDEEEGFLQTTWLTCLTVSKYFTTF